LVDVLAIRLPSRVTVESPISIPMMTWNAEPSTDASPVSGDRVLQRSASIPSSSLVIIALTPNGINLIRMKAR